MSDAERLLKEFENEINAEINKIVDIHCGITETQLTNIIKYKIFGLSEKTTSENRV